MGDVQLFSNFDPDRIQHYEVTENAVHIYMNEIHRMQAISEFMSTVEAFRYEVEHGIYPEAAAYKSFDYDFEFSMLTFVVDKELFMEDILAKMIERNIVEDCIRFQLYSRKPLGVTVKYVDSKSLHVFLTYEYPKEFK